MNSQHIVDSIVNRDYNEAEQSMFESLSQKLNDKIIESKYEVANQFREEMDGGTGYDAFFKKAMKKFGISSPADLKTDEKKKEFFDYIDKNFTAKNEAYGGMGMMRRRRKEEEEYSEEESGLRRGNPYLPVSTPDDRPPFDPRPVGGRPGPKIVPDPGFPGFPDFSDDPDDIPIGPGGLPAGYPGPKIVPDPGFPGVPPGNIPVEAELHRGDPEIIGGDSLLGQVAHPGLYQSGRRPVLKKKRRPAVLGTQQGLRPEIGPHHGQVHPAGPNRWLGNYNHHKDPADFNRPPPLPGEEEYQWDEGGLSVFPMSQSEILPSDRRPINRGKYLPPTLGTRKGLRPSMGFDTPDDLGHRPFNFRREEEMPEMGAEMMGMDKKKKMGKESDDLESAIKKALDVAGKEQAQAPQAQGGMPGMGGGGQMPPMGGGGQNPMAAMAKMMGGGGQMPPMGGGMKPPMGGGQMPPMGGGMKPPMGGGQMPPMGGGEQNPMAAMAKMMGGGMKRRKMGGGM